ARGVFPSAAILLNIQHKKNHCPRTTRVRDCRLVVQLSVAMVLLLHCWWGKTGPPIKIDRHTSTGGHNFDYLIMLNTHMDATTRDRQSIDECNLRDVFHPVSPGI